MSESETERDSRGVCVCVCVCEAVCGGMSAADAKLSKFRNAQLVAFIGPINKH